MPPRRKLAAAAGAVAILLAFTVFVPASTPGPLERDFEAYYAAGATVNAGADPYSRAIWSAESRVPGVDAGRDELLPFVGPAAGLPLWSVLARLSYRAAVAVWTLALGAALLAIAGAAFALTPTARAPWRVVVAVALTATAAPVIGSLALGQAALVAAAGIAAAVVTYRWGWPAGAFVATLTAAVQPNLALALLARLRSRWDLAAATSAAGAFALISLAAGGGPAGFAAYAHRLAEHGAAERHVAIQHTTTAIAYSLGIDRGGAAAIGAAAPLAAVLATIALGIRERLDATTTTLLACALLPFAVPFFHEHDFVIEVLPILVLGLRARGRARALAAIAAALLLVDWFGLAQRHTAAAQIISLGTAVACCFIALGSGPLRRADAAGLVTLALLASLAVPLGRAHPAPTWPDDLPAHYRATASADASAVWADEGRATGLLARVPAWGILRSFPLAGCIVLSAALVSDARRRRRQTRHRAGVGAERGPRATVAALPARAR